MPELRGKNFTPLFSGGTFFRRILVRAVEALRIFGFFRRRRDFVFNFIGCFRFVAGGGILLAIGFFGNWIFKKESMGGGDIKLIAMLGAFLGVEKVLLVFLFAPLAAIPFALYMKFARKAETIPFGPFLALAGALLFVYGDWIGKTLFYF